VEVNVPGVIAILVAPVVAQLSVLLEPELMLVGLAVKELIDGLGSALRLGFGEPFTPPQLVMPIEATRARISAPRELRRSRHPPSAARHMVALASNKPAAPRRRLPAPTNIKPRSPKPVVLMNAIVRGRPLCVCTELN